MPAQNFTACTAISQRFAVESGRIGYDAYTRGREKDPIWNGLVVQKQWDDQMGYTISNTVYQRSGLTAPPTWGDVVQSDGANINGCYPPLTVISNATTLQQYNRQWTALESNPLCLMDILASNEPRRAIAGFVSNLKDNAVYVRKERMRSEYERLATHKIVIAPGLPEDSAAFPLVQPTSPVTAGVLRGIYRRLQRESDGTDSIAKDSRGGENFLFTSSGETIENIIKADPDIRRDFRWSSRVDELLGSWSAAKISYGGFVMCEESFPPRFNWNGADFVRVPEYTPQSTTIGNKLEINPAWNNAQFEMSYVFHPNVFINRVQATKTDFGNGVTYGPQNYSFDFMWINEYDRNCNPDKNIGYFRARGVYASEPVMQQFGYALLGLRCNVALDLVPCASNSGYNSSPSGYPTVPDSGLQ